MGTKRLTRFYATHRGWRRDVNLLIRRLSEPAASSLFPFHVTSSVLMHQNHR